jgi:hypothetical protein
MEGQAGDRPTPVIDQQQKPPPGQQARIDGDRSWLATARGNERLEMPNTNGIALIEALQKCEHGLGGHSRDGTRRGHGDLRTPSVAALSNI